jgi:ABC-type dipeptide/oligopeptide/nickel transport system permease component
MTAYILRRLFYAVLTFFGITVATFVLIHSVPGDPISFFIGRQGLTHIPPDVLQAVREEFHLDEPLARSSTSTSRFRCSTSAGSGEW